MFILKVSETFTSSSPHGFEMVHLDTRRGFGAYEARVLVLTVWSSLGRGRHCVPSVD